MFKLELLYQILFLFASIQAGLAFVIQNVSSQRFHICRYESPNNTLDSCSVRESSPYDYHDINVIDDNTVMHHEARRQSEQTFYGFYPSGFETFDYINSPKEWISYSLNEEDCNSDLMKGRKGNEQNVWDELLQLNERIIPPPFTNDDLARVSKVPILSSFECQEIISECENHYWGWGSSFERYGTPDHRIGYMIKLEDLSRSYSVVNFDLLPRLFPAISNSFPSVEIRPENLRLGGCRIVKYNADEGRVELGMHRDGLLITANIALNDLDEYEGGGTIVEGIPSCIENPIRLKQGHVLLHPGDVRHGGAPITQGIRYVLVCFIFDTTIIPHEKYCQDRMQKCIENARSIPANDISRSKERELLFSEAAKHCSDAFAFGRMRYGEKCDGYVEMMNAFSKYMISGD